MLNLWNGCLSGAQFGTLALLFVFASGPRIAAAIDQTEALTLLVETLGATDDSGARSALLRGMLAGLDGLREVTPPKGWVAVSTKLSASEDASERELVKRLSQIFGDRQAIDQALAVLKNGSVNSTERRAALHSLLGQKNKEASDLLETLLDDPDLTLDAIRGYAIVQHASAPKILLDRYPSMTPDLRRAVMETLATRHDYATALITAIEQDQVARDEVPAHVARSLSDLLGDRFVKVFGKVRPVAEDRARLLTKYKQLISSEAIAEADASRGRVVFVKTCAACHRLYGEGGEVGPDLTGSNRADLNYILLNSVDPSYDVPDAYKTVTVLTTDGRVVNGVLAEEDEVRIVLKTAEQPRVVIAKADIETRKISPKSMMPDGQLDQMTSREVLDLIKYLRTTEQVEMAK